MSTDEQAQAQVRLPGGPTLEMATVEEGVTQVIPLRPEDRDTERAIAIRKGRLHMALKALGSIMEGEQSQQQDDPFASHYGAGSNPLLDPIPPDTPLEWWARLPLHSNILLPCMTAYARGISGNGIRLVPRITDQDDPRLQQHEEEIKAEKLELLEQLANLHHTLSLEQLREANRIRMEAVGFAGFEVIRDQEGRPSMLEPVFPHLIRMCPVDPQVVMWDQPVFDSARLQWVTRQVPRKFRRYVFLTRYDHSRRQYLKEYGDPRIIGNRTGTIYPDEAALQASKDDTRPANEFLRMDVLSLDGTYPIPRHAGVVDEISGSIFANELNLSRFINPIPPMAVLVSGGTLVPAAVKKVRELFEGASDYKSAPLVIEAEPIKGASAYAGVGGTPSVKIEIVPLDRVIDKDGLFQEYDQNNRDKIRASYRLSRMATGELPDLNRASANAGEDHDEEMVYCPERRGEDGLLFDRVLLPAWGIRWWRVETNATPGIGDEDLPELLDRAISGHAMSINELRAVLSRRLRHDLPPIPEKWAQVPPGMFDRGVTDPEDLQGGFGQPQQAPPAEEGAQQGGPTGDQGQSTGRDEDGERVPTQRHHPVRVAAAKRAANALGVSPRTILDAADASPGPPTEQDLLRASQHLRDLVRDFRGTP